jgi:hypothetical protein
VDLDQNKFDVACTPGSADGKREVPVSVTFLTSLLTMTEGTDTFIKVGSSFPNFPHCYIFFLILSFLTVLFALSLLKCLKFLFFF